MTELEKDIREIHKKYQDIFVPTWITLNENLELTIRYDVIIYNRTVVEPEEISFLYEQATSETIIRLTKSERWKKFLFECLDDEYKFMAL